MAQVESAPGAMELPSDMAAPSTRSLAGALCVHQTARLVPNSQMGEGQGHPTTRAGAAL